MPAIWIFMWRRLPVLAVPSSQREVIGIKLGCDICRCEMEMICKYNCLWREQNINTRHDQGMFIYHFILRFKTMVSWCSSFDAGKFYLFLLITVILTSLWCLWMAPSLSPEGQQGRRPSLIRRPAAAHSPPSLLNIYKVIVTLICHISVFDFHAIFNYYYVGSSWKDEGDDKLRCCIKYLLYFSMFLGVELYRPFKLFHISMKYKIINMESNYDPH